MSEVVLDASALLAYLNEEPSAEKGLRCLWPAECLCRHPGTRWLEALPRPGLPPRFSCNAHPLHELTYVFEEMGQCWAKRLIEMRVEACQEVSAAGGPLTAERIALFRSLYLESIAEGEAANPRAPPSDQRGRTRQSKAVNLLHRLRAYTDEVLRFMTDPGVPFTNNLIEQAVGMPKVKQKVSGCFHALRGAQSFCTLRSYLDTLRKQDANLFHALTLTFQGHVPQPRLA